MFSSNPIPNRTNFFGGHAPSYRTHPLGRCTWLGPAALTGAFFGRHTANCRGRWPLRACKLGWSSRSPENFPKVLLNLYRWEGSIFVLVFVTAISRVFSLPLLLHSHILSPITSFLFSSLPPSSFNQLLAASRLSCLAPASAATSVSFLKTTLSPKSSFVPYSHDGTSLSLPGDQLIRPCAFLTARRSISSDFCN